VQPVLARQAQRGRDVRRLRGHDEGGAAVRRLRQACLRAGVHGQGAAVHHQAGPSPRHAQRQVIWSLAIQG